MTPDLTIYAGKKAYAHIQDNGLRPRDVRALAGAAGGPKWLVLNRLDRLLFSSWLAVDRPDPVFMIGSSIGAWRFTAACRNDPVKALSAFETAYIRQRYNKKPSAREVTAETLRIMDVFVNDAAIRDILHHPFFRLNILAVRCRGLAADDRKLPLSLGVLLAAALNAVSRKTLRLFFRRTLFHDPRRIPPFFGSHPNAADWVPLNDANFRKALLASGSIPLVMSGVSDVPGAAPGVYRDGGVVDYHLDIPFLPEDADGFVLFPHYTDRVIPGWFDKALSWRGPDPERMSRVVLLAPSQRFVATLPFGKIPDRTDFHRFSGDDAGRFACWEAVVAAGQRLADAFEEAADGGRIREWARPFPQ